MYAKKKYQEGGSFEDKANKGNDAAKYLETGKGPDGMPLSAKSRAMYKKIAKENKNVYLMSPAPFEDDGMRKKGGMMPKYKKGGKLGKKKSLDFNKDGKITKADFIMMAKANAKKKK